MWLSIQGMYEYDESIFDGLEPPSYTDDDGNTFIIDKEKIINEIILECSELEIVYPSYETMKLAIGVWSASHLDGWNKLYASQIIKYNPIWNVDANIEQDRSIDRDRADEFINQVSGYNSENWANSEKNNATDQEAINEKFKERRTGNIGVTASQDLIKKERDIADFSIIDYITKSFKERFCIMIY